MWWEAGERPLQPEHVVEASPEHTLPSGLILPDAEPAGPSWNSTLISLAVLITGRFFLSLPRSEFTSLTLSARSVD